MVRRSIRHEGPESGRNIYVRTPSYKHLRHARIEGENWFAVEADLFEKSVPRNTLPRNRRHTLEREMVGLISLWKEGRGSDTMPRERLPEKVRQELKGMGYL